MNAFVAGFEQALGALVAMGHDDTQTVFTFDQGQPNQAPNAALILTIGGQAVAPTGHAVICQGDIFVVGQLVNAAAIR